MEGSYLGQSLGGGSGGGVSLSPDEIRRRRLTALSGGGSGSGEAPAAAHPDQSAASSSATLPPTLSVSIATTPAAVFVDSSAVMHDDQFEDEEAELQAALALSLHDARSAAPPQQQQQQSTIPTSIGGPTAFMHQEPVTTAQPPPPESSTPQLTEATVQQLIQNAYSSAERFDGITAFHKLMWDDQLTTDSDKNRWVSQGIDVRDPGNDAFMDTSTSITTATESSGVPNKLEAVAASHLPWGLVQQHGGPCGVLAAVQAELLRIFLFGSETITPPVPPKSFATEHLPVRTALARSIAVVLARATLTPSAVQRRKTDDDCSVRIVLPTVISSHGLTWQDLEPWHHAAGSSVSSAALTVYSIPVILAAEEEPVDSVSATPKRQKIQQSSDESTSLASRIHRVAHAVEAFLFDETRGGTASSAAPLDCFRRQGGVLLLVLSVTASRTVPVIQEEFDDPVGTRLTAQFGHCGQELMNLLLTGQAVSNVFDNTLSPSGDMVCRGIQSRPAIGYLTQLEAMRYCEVGGYYKSPLFPIWVVGSTSHFTVLFGDSTALKESKSDMLLDECRRAFKAVEGGEENGFIKTDQLESVLKTLNIELGGASGDDELARIHTLAASLEVGGAAIILWDDFWKAASRLLTGSSLETVLQGGDGTNISSPIIIDGEDGPPPLLTNYSANPGMIVKPAAQSPAASSALTNYRETDEEMARRLGAEWGSDGAGMSALTSVASLASSMEIDQPVMSDEEIARKLQEQFDSESAVGAGGASVAAVSGSPVPVLSDTDDNSTIPPLFTVEEEEEDTKPAAQRASTNSLAFEQYGDTFSLYHYNGLRGGILTPFRITRLTAEEAVGASIALNRGAGVSSHGSGGDLEDVVRTKWPSCVINWLGKQPPYID